MNRTSSLVAIAGLCAACVHSREVLSGKGKKFYRCALSDTDPRFSKYPRIPVLTCEGHEPSPADAGPDESRDEEPG